MTDKQLTDRVTEVINNDWLTIGMVVKLDGKIVFEKNEADVFPSASLIKLAILNYVLDQQVDLDAEFIVSSKNSVGGAGVLQLLSKQQWRLQDLLALMISVSDNFASNVLINHFGMGNINCYLQANGFSATRLNRQLMDSDALAKGIDNVTTAKESLRLLSMALGHGKKVSRWFANQQSRYKLPGNFDESGINIQVFNKTGEGNQIDHDVARFVVGSHTADVALLTVSTADRLNVIRVFNQVGQLVATDLEAHL